MSRDYVKSLANVSPLWWGAVAGAATAGAVIFPESRVIGAAAIGAAMLALAVYQTPCCADCADAAATTTTATTGTTGADKPAPPSGAGGAGDPATGRTGSLARMIAPSADPVPEAFDGGTLLAQSARVTSGACS